MSKLLVLLSLILPTCYTLLYNNTIQLGDKMGASLEMVEYASYISSLFLNQSSFLYPNAESFGQELVNNLRQRFFGKICGKDVDRDELIDYLGRQRTYHKKSNNCSDCNMTLFQIISHKPGLMFNVTYNVTNVMDLQEEVVLKVDADASIEGSWSIRSVDVSGSCVDSNNIDNKTIHDARWDYDNGTAEDLLNRIDEHFILGFKLNLIEDIGDHPFEAVIETDPMFTETYNWEEFVQYMKIFYQRYEVTNNTISIHGDPETISTISESDHLIARVRKDTKYLLGDVKDLWEFQLELFHNKDEERSWKIFKTYIRPVHPLPNRPIYELTNATKKNFEAIRDYKLLLQPELTKNLRIFRTCSFLHTQNTGFNLVVIPKEEFDTHKRPEVKITQLDTDQKYAPHINFELQFTYYTKKNNEKKTTAYRFYSEYDYKYDTYHIRDAVQACNQYGEGITFDKKL